MNNCTIAAAILVSVGWTAPAGEVDGPLADAIQKHQKALQSIRSVQCKVVHEEDYGPEHHMVFQGEYFRLGNMVRINEPRKNKGDGDIGVDILCANGATLIVPKRPGDDVNQRTAERNLGMSPNSSIDVWRNLVISYSGGLTDRIGLEEFIRLPGTTASASHLREDNQDYLRILAKNIFTVSVNGEDNKSDYDYDIRLDPTVNYLVRKMIMVRNGILDARIEIEIKEFIEPEKGVFFPTRAVFTSYKRNQVNGTGITKLSDVKINQPIDLALFHLAIPAGTRLNDEVNKKTFEVDVNGNPVGPVLPYEKGFFVGARITTPGKVKDK